MSYVSNYVRTMRHLGIYNEEQWRQFVSFFELPMGLGFDDPPNIEMQDLISRIRIGRNAHSNVQQPSAPPSVLSKVRPDRLSKPRAEQELLGVVSGCFDLLHLGHLQLFREARIRMSNRGDGHLLALVLGDSAVAQKKGMARPILSIEERVVLLASVRLISYVVPLADANCLQALDVLRPHFLFKHSRDHDQQIVQREAECVIHFGGTVVWLRNNGGDISTTNIIERSRSAKADLLEGKPYVC